MVYGIHIQSLVHSHPTRLDSHAQSMNVLETFDDRVEIVHQQARQGTW